MMTSKDAIYEAMSHLGAAISQSIHTDDEIIIGHIEDAHQILSDLWDGGEKQDVD